MEGSAFVGGMVGQQLGRVTLEGTTDALGVETLLQGELGRIRGCARGPGRLIYLALEHAEELTAVVRLEPGASDVMPPG